VAVEVVASAARHGAEHRSCPPTGVWVHVLRRGGQLRQLLPLVRDGIPDDELLQCTMVFRTENVEEDAAVAGVDRAPEEAHVGQAEVVRQADGGCGDERRNQVVDAEEAQNRRRAVGLAESAAEARVGDEAAPALAHEGSADEELGFIGREAEEDLSDDIINQCRL
jgi:hypothetical protein